MTDDMVLEVLSRLDPKIRKQIGTAEDVVIAKQPTPSVSLNHALKGGLAYGRQVLIYGNKSSGKSSFCLQMIGEAQADGKVCAWVDSEQSYSSDWAARLGVDTENLIYAPAKTINEVVNITTKLMKAGVDIVVIDSISAGMPGVFFEKKGSELKALEDTGQMGAEAKAWTSAVKMMNYANENTLLILISQLRTDISGMYPMQIPTGGQAMKFFSSTVIKLFASDSKDNAITKSMPIGDKYFEQIVGRKVGWKVMFNKTAGQLLEGDYNFYFEGDSVGVDAFADTIAIAVAMGIVNKGGTWYDFDGVKAQGVDNFTDEVRKNPLVYAAIRDKVYESM